VRGACLICALIATAVTGCGHYTSRAPVGRDPSALAAKPARDVYVIRRGDTLYSIAFRFGLDYRDLGRWNGIRPPYVIHPGARIALKPRRAPRILRPAPAAPTATSRRPAASGVTAPSKATTKASTKISTKTSPKVRAKARAVPANPRRQTAPGTLKKLKAPRASVPRPTALSKGKVAWQWPVDGKIIRSFSQSGNRGLDIGGPAGTPIRAAASGRIVYTGSGLIGYGELIIIKHSERFLTAYAHNKNVLVSEGQAVERGVPIAEMGNSGTNRVKLHFEIRKDGNPVDPMRYLPKR